MPYAQKVLTLPAATGYLSLYTHIQSKQKDKNTAAFTLPLFTKICQCKNFLNPVNSIQQNVANKLFSFRYLSIVLPRFAGICDNMGGLYAFVCIRQPSFFREY